MASMKQIKKRKKSVESTGKITKAMKLVATVKLQKVKQAATDVVPYFESMYALMSSVIKHTGNIEHKYLTGSQNGKKALIVFSSNKGLAGGYNSSIIKKIFSEEDGHDFTKDNTLIYAIGTKCRDELARRGFTIERDYSAALDDLHYGSGITITEDILNDFVEGKINEIYMIYTFFKNTIIHIPILLKILPLTMTEEHMMTKKESELMSAKKTFEPYVSAFEDDEKMPMNFEMDEDEMLTETIPKYIDSLLFGALVTSIASENGARMTAMDNATKNAEELSELLEMMYNRARQGAITQEITEIVAGANAI